MEYSVFDGAVYELKRVPIHVDWGLTGHPGISTTASPVQALDASEYSVLHDGAKCLLCGSPSCLQYKVGASKEMASVERQGEEPQPSVSIKVDGTPLETITFGGYLCIPLEVVVQVVENLIWSARCSYLPHLEEPLGGAIRSISLGVGRGNKMTTAHIEFPQAKIDLDALLIAPHLSSNGKTHEQTDRHTEDQ